MEPKLSEETLIEAFKKENDRSISILLQLSNLQTRFGSMETKFADLTALISKWNDAHQATGLKIQELDQRVGVLENKNSSRSGREWDLFKAMFPHLVTWGAIGAYMYLKTKGA
jgi:hypothetical protein